MNQKKKKEKKEKEKEKGKGKEKESSSSLGDNKSPFSYSLPSSPRFDVTTSDVGFPVFGNPASIFDDPEPFTFGNYKNYKGKTGDSKLQ